MSKAKLAEFGHPTPAEAQSFGNLIKEHETTKSYKMTKKLKNTLIFSIEKCFLIRVFTKLDFTIVIYLYTEKQHEQNQKNIFLVILLKQQLGAT